jgi:hypothetical protein
MSVTARSQKEQGSNGQATPIEATDGRASSDPFDLEALKIGQDFLDTIRPKKKQTSIQVRKPSKEWFVRVHPDPKFRLQTVAIELKEDRELYLVAPSIRNNLTSETTFCPILLLLATTRQNTAFLWPLKLPGADGRSNSWTLSAKAAAQDAMAQWIRVVPNMQAGGYDVITLSVPVPEPTWPEMSFDEIVRTAFKDAMIDDIDHPVLAKLRGEA